METLRDESRHRALRDSLVSGCGRCRGLCCTALYCAESEGFPADKEAGVPCRYLTETFRCAIHGELPRRRLRGCMAFECLGAGQKVSEVQFPGCDWRTHPEQAPQMFAVFLALLRLHRLLWDLTEAASLVRAEPLWPELDRMLETVEAMTRLPAEALCAPDRGVAAEAAALLGRVRGLLVRRGAFCGREQFLAGRSFRGRDLTGADLSGALLMAAGLSGCRLTGALLAGADLRDADVRGCDLRGALFLNQMQVNAARGDPSVRLPPWLTRPVHWVSAAD